VARIPGDAAQPYLPDTRAISGPEDRSDIMAAPDVIENDDERQPRPPHFLFLRRD